jgi:hypothetical protein
MGPAGVAVLLTAALLGCAAAPPPPPAGAPTAAAPSAAAPDPASSPPPAPPQAASAPPAAVSCAARDGAGRVKRSALVRTLDLGLGTWLKGVNVDPVKEKGKFRGWLVRSLHPGDPCWADVDLRAGDVVSRVNGRPIERPEQAHAVWTALRTAKEIVVDYTRSGTARTLRLEVIEDAAAEPAEN